MNKIKNQTEKNIFDIDFNKLVTYVSINLYAVDHISFAASKLKKFHDKYVLR